MTSPEVPLVLKPASSALLSTSSCLCDPSPADHKAMAPPPVTLPRFTTTIFEDDAAGYPGNILLKSLDYSRELYKIAGVHNPTAISARRLTPSTAAVVTLHKNSKSATKYIDNSGAVKLIFPNSTFAPSTEHDLDRLFQSLDLGPIPVNRANLMSTLAQAMLIAMLEEALNNCKLVGSAFTALSQDFYAERNAPEMLESTSSLLKPSHPSRLPPPSPPHKPVASSSRIPVRTVRGYSVNKRLTREDEDEGEADVGVRTKRKRIDVFVDKAPSAEAIIGGLAKEVGAGGFAAEIALILSSEIGVRLFEFSTTYQKSLTESLAAAPTPQPQRRVILAIEAINTLKRVTGRIKADNQGPADDEGLLPIPRRRPVRRVALRRPPPVAGGQGARATQPLVPVVNFQRRRPVVPAAPNTPDVAPNREPAFAGPIPREEIDLIYRQALMESAGVSQQTHAVVDKSFGIPGGQASSHSLQPGAPSWSPIWLNTRRRSSARAAVPRTPAIPNAARAGPSKPKKAISKTMKRL